MFRGGIGNAVLAPVSEILSRLLVQAMETVEAARDVLIEKESFAQLSSYMEKIMPVLKELQEKGMHDTPTIRNALESLERELKNAKELIDSCNGKSKIYLLVNCRAFVKRIQDITNETGRALRLIPLSTLNISVETREKSEALCRQMEAACFKAAVAQEEIIDKIDSGIRDRRMSANYANDLLVQIAKVVGVPSDVSALKQELDELKKERDAAQLLKNQAEALQLEQIMSVLKWADAASTMKETDQEYKEKRLCLGNYPVPPLRSFYCPITHDVMEDPVEVCTGQTYERTAIEKWFSEGHDKCPVTNEKLENLTLRPNIMLQRAVEEWKDRNTMIGLTLMEPKLKCEDEDIVMQAITELQDLCEQKNLHRYWIAAEGLIPLLVNLLRASKRNVRKKTLSMLSILVKNHNDNMEKVSNEGAIELAVRSLSRDDGEARKAVAFLLEISRHPKLCKKISKERGCLFLLVTRANSENPEIAADAKDLLENLSDNDANVVLMAEANYIKPLIQRLSEGSKVTKIVIANALSKMQLMDQSRANLVNEGVLPPLVTMASMGNLEDKSAALGALQNLSIYQHNRDPMVKAGVVRPLLEILFTARSVVTLREHAAATFANLATARTSAVAVHDLLGSLTDSDETIYQLLSLLNLTGPTIQSHVLRALNGICCSPSAAEAKNVMRVGGSCQLLASLYEANDPEVRLNALKLLYCLTQDGDDSALAEEMKENKIISLVNLISSSTREEEKAVGMGILSNLPVNDRHITERLLQAGTLTVIIDILTRCVTGGAKVTMSQLVENATGALIRFTVPTNLQLQKLTAELGVIPLLVHLLNRGSPLSKRRVAISLGQFSENSVRLSRPIRRPGGWFCFAPPDSSCRVHRGFCSVKNSFCLVEAEAVPALVQILGERDGEADEAALCALATLLYDECWEKGSEAIAEAQGVVPMLHLLTVGNAGVQERAVWILERIFRKPKYRLEYGNTAQMPLIALTQSGTTATRRLSARILAHLNILHDQSSYF